jgi:hypothetical protein
MKTDLIIHHLETNRLVFQSLLEGKEPDEYNFRPDKNSWTILEILCHLYDEEREDFRTRVKNTLTNPGKQPPPIDPPGWVKNRKYAEQLYGERLKSFLTERKESIKWLRSLNNPSWKNAYTHPTAGVMTAYGLLANWLAHDYHHIRQINRRLYEYLQKKSGVDLEYAGEW